MIAPRYSGRQRRTLTFDIENRPLSYRGGDFTSAEVTAIAWQFPGARIQTVLLGRETQEEILYRFAKAYEQADMVTGHFIRRHDLPILNGAMMEAGLPPLAPKLTSDTYFDLTKRKDLSASQESLADMLGVAAPKISMSQADWREANRLTKAGLAKTKRRVEGDVAQHVEVRAALMLRGLLKAPRVWRG